MRSTMLPFKQKRACIIVAEAGVNHNGDIEMAHRMIDAAAESGADLVKFQLSPLTGSSLGGRRRLSTRSKPRKPLNRNTICCVASN